VAARRRRRLDEALGIGRERDLEADDLCEALDLLQEIAHCQAQIVDLHFFYGLTFEEIAEDLGVSLTTVKREWRLARLWLQDCLHPV
jgi:RNA polymerase sigma factor (sigma-70 family)